MSTLERAIQIAAEAHAGQVDRCGAPYILHPLRVMDAVQGVDVRTVAVLHDVVEGTEWTPERLRFAGFSDAVVSAVDALTPRRGEEYLDFVTRAGAHPIGRVVKRADIFDNLDLRRLPNPGKADYQRALRYVRALAVLDGVGELG
jgi:hypothetical protein